ncbi:MAG: hypothetical protein V3Q69_07905 [Burkholderia sp.]
MNQAAWRCCINLARAGNGLRATVRASLFYQVRFQSNCLILSKKMRKDIHKTGELKAHYRVRNWEAYNGRCCINRA